MGQLRHKGYTSSVEYSHEDKCPFMLRKPSEFHGLVADAATTKASINEVISKEAVHAVKQLA